MRESLPYIVDAIKEVIADSHSIRCTALQQRVPIYTTIAGADAVSIGVQHINEFDVYSVQALHQELSA